MLIKLAVDEMHSKNRKKLQKSDLGIALSNTRISYKTGISSFFSFKYSDFKIGTGLLQQEE